MSIDTGLSAADIKALMGNGEGNGMTLKFVFASDSSLFKYLGKVRTRICP